MMALVERRDCSNKWNVTKNRACQFGPKTDEKLTRASNPNTRGKH